MIVTGKVVRVGDNIDTDLIIPAKHLKYTDPSYLAEHVFEAMGEDFRKKLKGAVIVAGRAFGIGSSREQAAIALKAAGVVAVLAESFSRIFYRNAINNGLPVLECDPRTLSLLQEGNEVSIDIEKGIASSAEIVVMCKPIRGLVLDILRKGGLISYLKELSTEEENARSCLA
ncbi:MAG: 3-isopropylmalate dehydratase [Acidilobaceae archaeon]